MVELRALTGSSDVSTVAVALLAYATPFPGAATVRILRDGPFAGTAVASDVYFDERLVGSISVEERITIYLPAGERAGDRPFQTQEVA
jgi:hypothetical protein